MSQGSNQMRVTWGSDELDLGAYLERTGYCGRLDPTAATMRDLHHHHVEAIPFENLDIIFGRPPVLDLASLQAKLVTRRRGGYCYEHNVLFAAVLERLGFAVTGLSARVTMGTSKPRPPTHMCLRAEAEGDSWLVDVGFGGDGMLEPIPLRQGQQVSQGVGAWQYSLAREATGPWALRSLRPQGWLELYTFTLEPRWPIDYQVFNWYTATHPRSPFTQRPIVQKAGDSIRRSLVGGELTVVRRDWTSQTRAVAPADVPGVLAADFGIELTTHDAETLCSLASSPSGSCPGNARDG
jgi:N-hydroxyarylamine O-acetyltransferase